jgi:hypothetical protein
VCVFASPPARGGGGWPRPRGVGLVVVVVVVGGIAVVVDNNHRLLFVLFVRGRESVQHGAEHLDGPEVKREGGGSEQNKIIGINYCVNDILTFVIPLQSNFQCAVEFAFRALTNDALDLEKYSTYGIFLLLSRKLPNLMTSAAGKNSYLADFPLLKLECMPPSKHFFCALNNCSPARSIPLIGLHYWGPKC